MTDMLRAIRGAGVAGIIAIMWGGLLCLCMASRDNPTLVRAVEVVIGFGGLLAACGVSYRRGEIAAMRRRRSSDD